ncbi:hypothetical protein FB550_102417 [Neobacillus bataviensis]|uniref:Uncharacterized protein n=1 Tax=Neobacillus bataviensis TaxID=220685 RepID=A0A561DSP2_9BACI|nr:hypothetical protein [Neobacillus bataviensis]TWE06395.1 hypothetical protein FB550_102417 [Neobacillus bataviensis]
MRIVHRVRDGLYIEDVILKDNQDVPTDCVEIHLPDGIYLPANFENGVWETTLTEEEVEALKNPEIPPLEIDTLKKEQQLMQQAIDDLILGGMF